MPAFGAFNQGAWSGVGDWDECWIIATYWALVVTGVMKRSDLPTIAQFRAVSGKPDQPGPSGGSNRDLYKALRSLAPKADVKLFVGSLASFRKQLQRGYTASLSVRSSNLPRYLQFGFAGPHQVSVYMQGGRYYIMNPLAKEGSALIEISASNLNRAAGALFGDNKLHAVLIKSGKAGTSVVKQKALKKPPKPPPAPRQPRTLKHVVPRRDYIEPYAAAAFYETRHGGALNSLDEVD